MTEEAAVHTFKSEKLRSVVYDALEFFDSTPDCTLPPDYKINGGGVYALYYFGDFKHYRPLAELNQSSCKHPIYIGKAVAPGWRTGRKTATAGADVYRRLREHYRSIDTVPNIDAAHFKCRFMVLNDAEADLVVPVEAQLIRKYLPLWNTAVDGFGNHDPGKGRYNQAMSEWDVLHPGREWSKRLTGEAPSLERIHDKIESILSKLSLS